MSDRGTDRAQLTDLLHAERDERRRLAELIHDGPVQQVAALSQMLDAAAQALGASDLDAARAIVLRALAVARDTSADLRDIAAGIEPATLREQGFAAAVEELAERLAARDGVSLELDMAASSRLGESAQVGLYQIVREALDQTFRRGSPSQVTVRLTEREGGAVELLVVDDGARERRQAVLDGLAERVRELNGTFAAERTAQGTTLRVTLPPSAASL